MRIHRALSKRPCALIAMMTTIAFLSIGTPARAGAPDPDFDSESAAEEANEGAGDFPAPALGEPAPPPIPIATLAPRPAPRSRPVLDPSARMLRGSDASEAWTLYIELESGHRITQRFLLSNAGPGEHNAVAVGHLSEPGRLPFRYENGRRWGNWTLSPDRLFFDISASHLDLHRPEGEVRITKDEIEIQVFFDFPPNIPSAAVPASRLPSGYHVEVLAVGVPARGRILAPWMSEPVESTGHAWLVHTWTDAEEARLLRRRTEFFGRDPSGRNGTSFYGIDLRSRGDWQSAWTMSVGAFDQIIESPINVGAAWIESGVAAGSNPRDPYPTPRAFQLQYTEGLGHSGKITLERDWLRYDPLEVIPQPFRWFIRRRSKPQEVWADARIGVSLFNAPDSPSLPQSGETAGGAADQAVGNAGGETTSTKRDTEASNAARETEDETASRSVTGVASITFLNPMSRR